MIQGLSDKHPYVRRTAVMGVLKIHHVDKSVVENTGGSGGDIQTGGSSYRKLHQQSASDDTKVT